VVAIVGRPNVGKSSVFNWLAGRRIAIVDPTAGVTRDRVSALIKDGPRWLELIDTGGMGVADVDNLTAQIEGQIDAALAQAHVLLFVVDARAGLAPLDEEVARRLRSVNKPVVLVANKCDTPALDPQAAEFYKLGRGQVVCVSAQQNRGRPELLDLILKGLPAPETLEAEPRDPALKLAIVGRRNTGKSTFINSLARSERMIVSEVPGTTRDSVDVRFERDGLVFVAIDTAGVRRKGSIASDIEFYSIARAERTIRRADVVLLFLDPRVRISNVDKQ
jgi:GTP-binding protein